MAADRAAFIAESIEAVREVSGARAAAKPVAGPAASPLTSEDSFVVRSDRPRTWMDQRDDVMYRFLTAAKDD